jgi:biotin carboxylase
MGFDVIVISEIETARIRDVASLTILCDPGSPEAVEAAVKQANLGRVNGVFSLGFDNPPVISRLCRNFGTPGLSEEVALDCTRKDRRLKIFQKHGLRIPRFAIAKNSSEALAGIEFTGLPAVIKPTDRSGSLGVAKVDSMRAAIPLVRRAFELSPVKRVVVEEFLVGTEHTVAGFCVRGKVHCTGFSDRDYRRKEDFPPFFFESGDTMPTALNAADVAHVMKTVDQGLQALRLDPAFFNADVLVLPDGDVVLIELAGRVTGARIATEVVPLATGVDPLANLVRLSLGRDLELSELKPTRHQAVVQRYLPSNGRIVDWVGDINSASKSAGIYDLFWVLEPKVGLQLPPYRSADDVLAGIISVADTVANAEHIAFNALESLPLRFRPA